MLITIGPVGSMCTLTFLLFLLAFGFLTAVHGQKTRFGQAPQKPVAGPFKVHVRASHNREDCSTNGCVVWLYVDVVLNGKNLERLGASTIGKHHSASSLRATIKWS
jgi:hypothetical protein